MGFLSPHRDVKRGPHSGEYWKLLLTFLMFRYPTEWAARTVLDNFYDPTGAVGNAYYGLQKMAVKVSFDDNGAVVDTKEARQLYGKLRNLISMHRDADGEQVTKPPKKGLFDNLKPVRHEDFKDNKAFATIVKGLRGELKAESDQKEWFDDRRTTIEDELRRKIVGDKASSIADNVTGAICAFATTIYARRTYNNIMNAYRETVGLELGKDPAKVGFRDVFFRSQNEIVRTTINNFIRHNTLRYGTDLTFFSVLGKTPGIGKVLKWAAPGRFAAIGAKATYLSHEYVFGTNSLFEDIVEFSDQKLRAPYTDHTILDPKDIWKLYASWRNIYEPGIPLEEDRGADMKNPEHVFVQHVTDLLNFSYQRRRFGGDNPHPLNDLQFQKEAFTLPKFILLLGGMGRGGFIDLSTDEGIEKSLVYVNVLAAYNADHPRESIFLLDKVRDALEHPDPKQRVAVGDVYAYIEKEFGIKMSEPFLKNIKRIRDHSGTEPENEKTAAVDINHDHHKFQGMEATYAAKNKRNVGLGGVIKGVLGMEPSTRHSLSDAHAHYTPGKANHAPQMI